MALGGPEADRSAGRMQRARKRLAPRSLLRATFVSPMASLIRGRLASGFAIRCLTARLVLAASAERFAVRYLAARVVHGRPAVRLALRCPTTRLILSRLA